MKIIGSLAVAGSIGLDIWKLVGHITDDYHGPLRRIETTVGWGTRVFWTDFHFNVLDSVFLLVDCDVAEHGRIGIAEGNLPVHGWRWQRHIAGIGILREQVAEPQIDPAYRAFLTSELSNMHDTWYAPFVIR